MSDKIPTIWIEIPKLDGGKILMCGHYREWDHSGEKSIDDQLQRIRVLIDQVERAIEETRHVLIIGDMNMCSKKWDDGDYRIKTVTDEWQSAIARCGIEHFDVGDTYTADHASKDGTFATSSIDHIYCSTSDTILNYARCGWTFENWWWFVNGMRHIFFESIFPTEFKSDYDFKICKTNF